ncbi:carotenoid biosynthesis protein [Bacillaceae bacterium SIJ1]|uniref:carotenoid biosynthesis protein n=1 Tax=Litoribacterium kuwaitense TaxID=1398745 RepID=UPI0013EDCC57|nr:carotenoid biosynthesis protein [Litoribacterium kuwaitense]NGP44536.1 carotenoid biosynthesis protein [Litoribacterium kuwaitense]
MAKFFHPRSLYILFLFWYVNGVFLLGFDILPSWLEWSNGVFLVLAGLLGCVYFYYIYQAAGLWYSLLVFVLSMGTEALGVNFNILFGSYNYHGAFGIEWAGVPVGIGFAWIMVMATSHALAKRITSGMRFQTIAIALFGTAIAVSMDLLLDPVSTVRGYWTWNEPGTYYDIPLQNFIGWAVLSFFLHLIKSIFLSPREANHVWWEERMVWLYTLIVGFFAMLAVLEGIPGAAFLVIALTALWLLLYLNGRKREVKNDEKSKQAQSI